MQEKNFSQPPCNSDAQSEQLVGLVLLRLLAKGNPTKSTRCITQAEYSVEWCYDDFNA